MHLPKGQKLKKLLIQNICENKATGSFIFSWWVRYYLSATVKTIFALSFKFEHIYTNDPAILFLVYTQNKCCTCAPRNTYKNVHDSVIQSKCPKVRRQWVIKQYQYKWATAISENIHECPKHYVKQNKHSHTTITI